MSGYPILGNVHAPILSDVNVPLASIVIDWFSWKPVHVAGWPSGERAWAWFLEATGERACLVASACLGEVVACRGVLAGGRHACCTCHLRGYVPPPMFVYLYQWWAQGPIEREREIDTQSW